MTGTIYLQHALAKHRRGRLLTKLTHALEIPEELPDDGVILAIGQDFQNSDQQEKTTLIAWCQRPGRTLLLLPPFQSGKIFDDIDWTIAHREPPAPKDSKSVAALLADEVTLDLVGHDGAFEASPDGQWQDNSPNYRYLKKHSGTGVIAATTLPLWSISLMTKGEQLNTWIAQVHSHAGKPVPAADDQAASTMNLHPEPVDYTTMVCIYGWKIQTRESLLRQLATSQIFTIAPEVVEASLTRLAGLGYLTQPPASLALSKRGLQALQASSFFGYAEHLRTEDDAP